MSYILRTQTKNKKMGRGNRKLNRNTSGAVVVVIAVAAIVIS
jgi:hypothetical protein